MLVDICSDLEAPVIVGNSINYLRTLRSWLSPVARSVNSGGNAVGMHLRTIGLQVYFTHDVMARDRL